MQSGVLVHIVVREYEAFMVQAAAVGPSTEDHVAMALVGAVGPLAEDLVAAQLKQLALWRRVGWWLVCSKQSSFRQGAKWQLTSVGAVVGLMQQLRDLGSLMNLV